MSAIIRNVTVKEDEHGLYVLFKPQFDSGTASFPGGKFVIRIPSKRNMFDSDTVQPFVVGEKVAVQEFNPNMGWYKVRRKHTGCTSLWDGPRWETNGFTSGWVSQ